MLVGLIGSERLKPKQRLAKYRQSPCLRVILV